MNMENTFLQVNNDEKLSLRVGHGNELADMRKLCGEKLVDMSGYKESPASMGKTQNYVLLWTGDGETAAFRTRRGMSCNVQGKEKHLQLLVGHGKNVSYNYRLGMGKPLR